MKHNEKLLRIGKAMARFLLALAVGAVLWYATRGVRVYTDPFCDPACGNARFYGLPLPTFRADECSTFYSIMADAKPGRDVLNFLFWCFLSYALISLPRIVRWLRGNWKACRVRLAVAACIVLAAIAMVCVFRHEIIAGWYAPREWRSPHGYKRLPESLWPQRTWWQDVLSYF